MKLLFDQNISFRISKRINHIFAGCKHVSDCGLVDNEDNLIWNYAQKNNFTIVSFDSDFYELSLLRGHPPKIIWIRTGNLSTKELTILLTKHSIIINNFIRNTNHNSEACLELDSI